MRKNPGSSTAYCRHQHYLPVKCRSSRSTWENYDELSLFPRCLLMLEALARYTGSGGQYSRNMWISRSSGEVYFYEAPGKCPVTWPFFTSCCLFQLGFVSFGSYPLQILSIQMLKRSPVRHGEAVKRLEVKFSWRQKSDSFAPDPVTFSVGSSSPSTQQPPPHKRIPTIPKRVNISWQRTNLWS